MSMMLVLISFAFLLMINGNRPLLNLVSMGATIGVWSLSFPFSNSLAPAFSHFFYNDALSWGLCLLTAYSLWFMVLASNTNHLTDNLYVSMKKGLTLVLFLSFLVKSYFLFYFAFELSLIPIFLMVMGWGYQPERLAASTNLLLYTIFGSLPLLILIVNSLTQSKTTDFFEWAMSSPQINNLLWHTIIGATATAAFLVKFPLFMVHLWLPKAHVEAPVAGSMILAAVLLKLGGYGLIRMMPAVSMSAWLSFIKFFSMFGGSVISILCVRQTDMKVLIAYSSVGHMSLAIAGIMMASPMCYFGTFLMLLAHGLSSAGMFAGANVIYLQSHSRSLVLSKSLMSWSPAFTLMWFLLCLGNMGGPPTLNLVSEIYLIMGLSTNNILLALPLALAAFLAAAYTLVLYSSSQQGQLFTSNTTFTSTSILHILLLSSLSVSLVISPLLVFLI